MARAARALVTCTPRAPSRDFKSIRFEWGSDNVRQPSDMTGRYKRAARRAKGYTGLARFLLGLGVRIAWFLLAKRRVARRCLACRAQRGPLGVFWSQHETSDERGARSPAKWERRSDERGAWSPAMVKVTIISMTNFYEILLNVIMGRNVRQNFAVPQQQCCARSAP